MHAARVMDWGLHLYTALAAACLPGNDGSRFCGMLTVVNTRVHVGFVC
jgi:hypothetical protein